MRRTRLSRRRFAGFLSLLLGGRWLSAPPRAVAAGTPMCSFTAEQLAILGHQANAFPGLSAVRRELPPGFPFHSALQPLHYCAAYVFFWEVPFEALVRDPDADANRAHSDLLLAFPTAGDASDAFHDLVALSRSPTATQRDPQHRIDDENAPSLGEERLAQSTTEFGTEIDGDGTRHEEPNIAQYDFAFRRGPVLVLSDDTFSPDAADFGLALSLAEALDARIAAALQ